MSNVWEEEWTSDGERVELCGNEEPYGRVVVASIGSFHCRQMEEGMCNEVGRAQLAAAAPGMARMLIEVENACDDGYDENEVGLLVLKLRPQILELLKKIGC